MHLGLFLILRHLNNNFKSNHMDFLISFLIGNRLNLMNVHSLVIHMGQLNMRLPESNGPSQSSMVILKSWCINNLRLNDAYINADDSDHKDMSIKELFVELT